MKLKVQILDEDDQVLAESIVRNVPEDLNEHPVDPFADLEGRLREAAGAAAYIAHRKAKVLLKARA